MLAALTLGAGAIACGGGAGMVARGREGVPSQGRGRARTTPETDFTIRNVAIY